MTKTPTQIFLPKQIRTKHREDDNPFFLYNHDIFLAVLFQSKLNISNYELMNEACIVSFPCLYIKARKSTKIIRSSISYFSDLCRNCQHAPIN